MNIFERISHYFSIAVNFTGKNYPWMLFVALTIAGCFAFFMYYLAKVYPSNKNRCSSNEFSSSDTGTGTHEDSLPGGVKNFFHKPHPLTLRDAAVMLVICIIYGIIAFWGLGSTNTPQDFTIFETGSMSALIGLPKNTIPKRMFYYTAIGTGYYDVYYAKAGGEWSEPIRIEQKYSELLKWKSIDFPEDIGEMDYILIDARNSGLQLGEIAVYDINDNRIKLIPSGGQAEKLLAGEEHPVVTVNYLYNSYFDEIYHARTAYEHLTNIYPYEISHPPLGKITISAGISIFGMNPFGWRFMGTLFGIFMLPILYIFIKNLFGKTLVATCGTLLFAFDFMHFVQTRIATIDTYSVIFIMLMFYFMYRYFVLEYDVSLKKTLMPLFFSGLFFGIGAASKWTVIYGGIGLLTVYAARQILVGHFYLKQRRRNEFIARLALTIAVSIVFFIIVPVIIYLLSYIPYGTARGMSVPEGMLWDKRFLDIVIENQISMFNYHSRLEATHSYGSPWWMWILNLRPILYYLQTFSNGTKSAFGAFGNPVVWWTGIAAMISMVTAAIKRRDKIALFIFVGYFSQLLPWIFITRVAFIYHYFPNVIFLTLGISYMFNDLCELKLTKFNELSKQKKINLQFCKKLCPAVLLLTGGALLMFFIFYPVLSGLAVNQQFSDTFLRWFDGMWPF